MSEIIERESDYLAGVARTLSHCLGTQENTSGEVRDILDSHIQEGDLYVFLKTGKSEIKYTSEQLIPYITSDNFDSINERVLAKLIAQNKDFRDNIVTWITSENISRIHWRTIDLIMTHNKKVIEILDDIKFRIRETITKDNEKDIDRFILDAVEYGGEWGEFVRTFSPEGQKRWKKIAGICGNIKKSIGFSTKFL